MSDWWSELLQYSVQSSEWWSSVLQGALGAFLSVLGLFGVFTLTRRHDLQRDKSKQDAEQAKADEERTLAGVAAIMQAALALRTSSLNGEEDPKPLSDELMMFCVREIRDHPNAALWAKEESDKILEYSLPSSDFRALSWEAGVVSATLIKWVNEGFPESIFSPANFKDRPLIEITPNDEKFRVTRGEIKKPTDEIITKVMKFEEALDSLKADLYTTDREKDE